MPVGREQRASSLDPLCTLTDATSLVLEEASEPVRPRPPDALQG